MQQHKYRHAFQTFTLFLHNPKHTYDLFELLFTHLHTCALYLKLHTPATEEKVPVLQVLQPEVPGVTDAVAQSRLSFEGSQEPALYTMMSGNCSQTTHPVIAGDKNCAPITSEIYKTATPPTHAYDTIRPKSLQA